jgi:hypothetical protein
MYTAAPGQTRKSPIPVPPIPDLAGNRPGGRESPIPDSAEIGNREIPRFPIKLAGNRESGSRLAANREIGDTLCVSTSCTILGWMLP